MIRSLSCLLLLGLLPASAGASSLQEKIDRAAPNEEIRVGAGLHAGPLVIDKPLKLIGAPGAEILGNGSGKVIAITGNHVTVQGFRIRGSGLKLAEDDAAVHVTGHHATVEDNRIDDSLHGVYLKKVRGARIVRNVITGKSTLPAPAAPAGPRIVSDSAENCDLNVNSRGNGIHLWNSDDNLIEGNTISETRDGIYFSFTNRSVIRHNSVHHVRYGLHYMYSDDNTFENNLFTKNAAGAAVMFSKNLIFRENRFVGNEGSRAYGMLLNSVDTSQIDGNDLSHNTVGIYLENSNVNALSGNFIRHNYIGVRLSGSSDANVFTHNRFARNMHPAELAGEIDSNRWTAGGRGNHWQDAGTIDLNRDQIGDLPHREADLLGGLRRPFPLAGLLSGSPGLNLLRLAHRHVALPEIPALKDSAPLLPGFVAR